jgi:tetratricopeptide (TPR) repeat protein/DNA-binding SARP family transcriptional activator
VALGHAKQKSVLAVLLADAGRVVAMERIVGRVWGDDAPCSALNILSGYVTRLRQAFAVAGADGIPLWHRPGGYIIDVDSEMVDMHLFGRLVAAARVAQSDTQAAELLRRAVGLWRGPAFAGLPSPWLQRLGDALDDELWNVRLDATEIELRQGHHGELVGQLSAWSAERPLDERLAGQLMLAIYRQGQQALALERYLQIRRRLADELGVDPSPDLQERYQQILRSDSRLAVPGPASQRLRRIPAQLPHGIRGFTGRQPELDRLRAIVAAGEAEPDRSAPMILAIDGPAGVGKTALALRFAHESAGKFPGGQLYIDLRGFAPAGAPLSAHDALRHLLLGLLAEPAQIPSDIGDQAAMLRTLTAHKRMMLVLDNAATAGQVRPLLPGSSGCLVLVTSRTRLSGLVAFDGACQLTLDPLAPDEAVALLAQIAGASRVAAEQDAAHRICQLCGFLPLAVRMAAARATARPGHMFGELAEELAHPGQQLDLGSDGELTTVRAVFSWSCRALNPDAARMFGLLGLHPGTSISAPCAAMLAGIPEASARRQLQALVGAHMLEDSGHDRYRLPGLLRLYAAERSADEPGLQRADALCRMLAWYLHTAAAASRILAPRPPLPIAPPPTGTRPLPLRSQAQALAWFEAERTNLIAATRLAASTGEHALAWQLPVTCWDFFYRRKHLADWVDLSTVGLVSAQRVGDRYGEGWAWQSLGDAYRDMRRFSDAVSHLEQALAVRREIGDRQGEGWALANLGECYLFQRQYVKAISFYRQAAAVERDADDRWGLAITLTNIGEASRGLGRYENAFAACQQALAIHCQISDQHSEAWTLNNLARLYQRLHRWPETLGHARRALAIQHEINDRWGQSITLTTLADIDDATGQPAQAIDHYQQALSIQVDLADRHGQASTLTHLAGVLQRTRQLDAAQQCLRQASQLSHEPGHP